MIRLPKCKCGVKLFNKDIVDRDVKIYNGKIHGCSVVMATSVEGYTYRCPKCFKIKKVRCGD